MSNLNFDILAQSVEKLSRQYEKNLLNTENEKVSLQRATALLEGLKGMFGMDDVSLNTVENNLCVSVVVDDCTLELFLDPSAELKLTGVQAKRSGELVDVTDVMGKCSGLAQPNDIRQALYLLRERVTDQQ